ncbi:Helicase associated domain protein [Streptomyces sp. NPDC006333]|uniref:Helicase associated domain protein n=1 Tax=Streptomyces sp. NPDC006333 TaxID=3156753 RepID=UPI0033A8987D
MTGQQAGTGTAMAAGAAGRVAPLHGELTLSFLSRVAARYHLGIRELLSAVTETDSRQNISGMLYPDSEIYLNAPARARVRALCRLEEDTLTCALPAWAREEPCGRGKGRTGPTGRLTRGEQAVDAWGPACPACTAARTGRHTPARRYLAPHQRVCPRHRYWLLHAPGTSGFPVPLAACPDVIAAHHRHIRLLEHSPVAAPAFDVARAITGSWWEQPWPADEQLWPARLAATLPRDSPADLWRVLARDLATYPETIAIATVLASPRWQQQTLTQTRGHLPHRLGEVPTLLSELAARLQRPWLAARLATDAHGPLFTWVHTCVHTHAAPGPDRDEQLWQVHSTHRPRPLSDLLPPPAAPTRHDHQQTGAAAKRLRGHSLLDERSFAKALTAARAYHQQHGHLAVPAKATQDGYPLGPWLGVLRTRHTKIPVHQAATLTALYPWWNAPWSTLWQRVWHLAHTHHHTHSPLDARRGFPTPTASLTAWLRQQCLHYDTLHPAQQTLLTDIGITATTAAVYRTSRRDYTDLFEQGLTHARAYAAQHGTLQTITPHTTHNGYRLGQWLQNKRRRTRTGHPLPPDQAQALNTIDPWWNPPWHQKWQHAYHHAHTNPDHPTSHRWLQKQHHNWHHLHPDQQHLLTAINQPRQQPPSLYPPPPNLTTHPKQPDQTP